MGCCSRSFLHPGMSALGKHVANIFPTSDRLNRQLKLPLQCMSYAYH